MEGLLIGAVISFVGAVALIVLSTKFREARLARLVSSCAVFALINGIMTLSYYFDWKSVHLPLRIIYVLSAALILYNLVTWLINKKDK